MKPRGRVAEPLTELQITLVREYLSTTLTMAEVAAKYNVKTTTAQYWVRKYRKEFGLDDK